MHRVQGEAVARFTAHGFDAVTVEEIADAAEVSAMSVYRWFGTKEALVIWDEYDPPLLQGIAARLTDRPPLTAVRDALVEQLDELYDSDSSLILQRTLLIYREPALLAAADRNMRAFRAAITEVFETAGHLHTQTAVTAAAVTVALLETAIDAWQRDAGRTPLRELLIRTFTIHQDLHAEAASDAQPARPDSEG